MSPQYFALHVELHLLGLILLALILVRIGRDYDGQATTVWYVRVIVAAMLLLLIDLVRLFIENWNTPTLVVLNNLFAVASYFMMGFICDLWMRYVACTLRVTESKCRRVLLALPLMALTVLIVLSPWTHWVFEVTADNVLVLGPLFFVQELVCFGYVLGTGVYALRYASREKNRARRANAWVLASFAILPVTGALIVMRFTWLPAIWPLTAISLVMVYLNLQSDQISTDALTGLNNRRQFDRHLAACLESRGEEPVHLLLMDVDAFKRINDTFGHAVGDTALEETANVLRQVCSSRDVFLARYGGDEFAVISALGGDAPERIKGEVQAAFVRFNASSGRPYRLSLSIGVGGGAPADMTPCSLIELADAALYEEKKRRKRAAEEVPAR